MTTTTACSTRQAIPRAALPPTTGVCSHSRQATPPSRHPPTRNHPLKRAAELTRQAVPPATARSRTPTSRPTDSNQPARHRIHREQRREQCRQTVAVEASGRQARLLFLPRQRRHQLEAVRV
ncbi:MAG TPA: hypothetical protein VIU15_02740, partial [Streptomyces sp.]